jgi:hypothetical protein
MDKGKPPQPPKQPEKKTGFLGKKRKRFSGNLKAGSNKKNSATWCMYKAAVAMGEDVPSLARPVPTGARSSAAARKPMKTELEESLRLTNAYTDHMEGERDAVQKICDKNLKGGDNWKASAELAHVDRRVVIGQLKSTVEERDAIASELEEEMLMKSMQVALATSEAKASNFALTVHCLCLQYTCTLFHWCICSVLI